MSRCLDGFRLRRSKRASTNKIELGQLGLGSTALVQEELSSVDAALKAASNKYEPRDDKGFLNAYAHISTRKKFRIEEIFGISVCYDGKSAPEEDFANSNSLLSCLHLLEKLLSKQSDSFLSCLFTAENSKSNAAPMWAFLKPLPAQIRCRNDVPRKALIYFLSQIGTESGQSLYLPDLVVREIAQAAEPRSPTPMLKLPSTRAQESQIATAVEHEQLTWTFRWQSVTSEGGDSLRYKNDLEAYIWQSCSKPPSSSYLKIFIVIKPTPRNIRAALFFGSLESLKTFREGRAACRDKFCGAEKVAFRLGHQIYSAYYVVISDMMRFAQEMADVIVEMTFVGRARPSKVKVQHLLHMNDRREKAVQDMTQNLSYLDEFDALLQSLLTPIQSPTDVENPVRVENDAPVATTSDGQSLKTAMETLRLDFAYVLNQLKDMEPKLRMVREEIQTQNSLQSPNFALNTLAAIYVPLAFVTSFLGMNVTESPVKRWLNPDVASGGQDAPTQRLWDMRWFAILSAPLLLGTILLPLLAGPVVRWTFRRYVKLGVFWRLIFVLIGLAYPALCYGLVYHVDSFLASFLLPVVCDATLAAFSLYQGYLAFRLGDREAVWTFTWVFALTMTCSLLDFLPLGPFLLYGAFGWFIIFLTRLYSYSRGWDAKRRKRRDFDTRKKENVMSIFYEAGTLPTNGAADTT